ncbi:hypothetical protein J7E99_11835 [Streptomyces sp. ISL-44]|uniref:hypothetical protein n=1 Tax=Streptomyces sp. ISL-44 TaxID=2819184 RepID=UPI001BED1A16|nr:hypothetical protein [Streptomyces sp. ISL-44]MBT2541381.1 hypothetical protein [Streptomyces sp. ISL-44]
MEIGITYGSTAAYVARLILEGETEELNAWIETAPGRYSQKNRTELVATVKAVLI